MSLQISNACIFEYRDCIFEINIGCNTLEGNSNLRGGKVNADVKM